MRRLTLTEILQRSPTGSVLYTPVKDMTAATYATRAGVKISTERILAIHPGKRELIDLTRITVLGEAAPPPTVKRSRKA